MRVYHLGTAGDGLFVGMKTERESEFGIGAEGEFRSKKHPIQAHVPRHPDLVATRSLTANLRHQPDTKVSPSLDLRFGAWLILGIHGVRPRNSGH
jgi:hypothetical protein